MTFKIAYFVKKWWWVSCEWRACQ